MDQAIRIDNRIFERRQEQQYNPRTFRRTNLQINLPLAHSSAVQHICDNFNHHPIHNLLLRSLQLPSNTSTTDDMDIDLHVVVLSLPNDNRGLVKDFVLFAVSQDTSKHLSSVQLSL
ncbi:hypothetical protein BASA81_017607 [Batrachochytrium salamandrivorans]|nr:hypothetical protein BASA81_017607 [Batrachochytrium salamandrivorans]